jgi:hypothetical protein
MGVMEVLIALITALGCNAYWLGVGREVLIFGAIFINGSGIG